MPTVNEQNRRWRIRKPTNTFRVIRHFLEICRSRSDNTYIPRPLEEADIQSFLGDDEAARCLVLGHTGIGKSTLLDHCLPLPMKRTAVCGDSLRILIRFDRAIPADPLDEEYGAYISDALAVLQKDFGIGPTVAPDYPSEIVQYIREYRGHLLHIKASERSEYASDSELYEHIRKTQTLRFPLVALKYWIAAANADSAISSVPVFERPRRTDGKAISSVVIVIDDLEGDQGGQPDKHIDIAFTMHECLSKQDGIPEHLQCRIKTIIGIRKTTLAALRDHHEDFLLAYNRPRLIDLEGVPPIRELFDSYKHLIGEKAEQQGWLQNYEVVMRIGDALETSSGSLMGLLANYDIRLLMNAFCEVLCDSENFADDLESRLGTKGAFRIRAQGYKTQSRVAFLLALGYQGYNLYDARANDEAYIPNIVRENGLFIDFIDLYLLVHAQQRRRVFDLTAITACFSRMTDRQGTSQELDADINEAVSRLCKWGLLIDETYLNMLRGNPNRRGFALMPRGEGLLTAMRLDSAVLELYRDDCWIIDSGRTTQELRQQDIDELTADVCTIVERVCEYDFARLAHMREGEDLDHYKRCFGDLPVGKVLLTGFSVAVNSFIQSGDRRARMHDVQRRVGALSAKIAEWTKTLGRVVT